MKTHPKLPVSAGIILLGLQLFFGSRLHSQSVRWVSSTAHQPWQTHEPLTLQPVVQDAVFDLDVRTNQGGQTILGWGGCFNELGWCALQGLSPEHRESVLRSLFDPHSGLNFTICRMPIGANDYATNWYSLDETPGDFGLTNFSLERDRALLIPYIKAAMRIQPKLQIWGSPWSPPAWMKMNHQYGGEGANRFVQEKKYLAAYAHYFVRYVEDFRSEGIPVVAVGIQNEPFYGQQYPSCRWTPEEMRDFVARYLGPTFRREKVPAEIWLATMNNNDIRNFDTILASSAGKYISAVGIQWAGKNAVSDINVKYPGLKKVQTESECGRGTFDWKAAEYTFGLIKHYLANGVNIYDYWNLVLDESGNSHWGWKQNALITVNSTNQAITYTPEYYLFKHLSHFVKPGAIRLENTGPFDHALAFLNPDGDKVVVAVNADSEPAAISARVGDRCLKANLPGKSFNTFVIP